MTQNNWTKCELGDVVSLEQEKISCTFAKETSYVSTENMLPNKGGVSIISSLPAKGSVSVYKKDDVLISNIRPYFKKIWQAKNDGTCSGDVLVFRAKKVEPRFLYFVLSDESFFDYVMLGSKGTKMPRGDKQQIMKYPLPNLPPLEEQKRIAGVLGAFDDKIELLQKQNKTLEDMAKAIFKSWFVDFDIVKAKQRGEDKQKILSTYKITEELYNLFPSSFTDAPASSSLGPIPLGWEVKQIKDICKMDRGLSYKSENLVPSDTALVTLKSFNRGGGYRLDGLKSYSGKYKAEQEVFLKDIVVACTDVTQNAEVVGKPAIVLSKYPFKKLLASCDLVILRPYEENKRAFIWQLLMSEYYQKYILAFVSGTTVLHLNKEGINIYQFPFSNEISSCFSNLVNTYIDKIISNYSQIQTLTELRDGLLPRLLSGKLKV